MHQPLISTEDVDDFIVIQIRAFARKVQRAVIREALAAEDLPVLEWQLLFSIARFGSCHLAHVTNHTSIDPAHGSRAVAALEKKGLIERQEDPENRRRKLISMTPDGVALFERIWPNAQAQVRKVTDQLEPEDFADFKRIMRFLNVSADILKHAPRTDLSVTKIKERTKQPV